MSYATELALILDELSKQELVSVTQAFRADNMSNEDADKFISLLRAIHDRFLFNRISGAAEARSKTAVEQIEALCKELKIDNETVAGQTREHRFCNLIYEKRTNRASVSVDQTQFEIELQKMGVTENTIDIAKKRATKEKKPATYHTVTIVG